MLPNVRPCRYDKMHGFTADDVVCRVGQLEQHAVRSRPEANDNHRFNAEADARHSVIASVAKQSTSHRVQASGLLRCARNDEVRSGDAIQVESALILLRHKFNRAFRVVEARQHGHRGKRLTSASMMCRRIVAIEFGT